MMVCQLSKKRLVYVGNCIKFRSQKGFLDHHKRHTSTCSYKSKELAKKNNRQGIEKQRLRDNGRKTEKWKQRN